MPKKQTFTIAGDEAQRALFNLIGVLQDVSRSSITNALNSKKNKDAEGCAYHTGARDAFNHAINGINGVLNCLMGGTDGQH